MTQQEQADKFIKNNAEVCIAILCVTVLEMAALFNGINGTMFSISIAIIAGLAGLVIPTPNFMKGGK